MVADGGSERPLRVTQIITTLARGGAQATVLGSAAMADRGAAVRVLVGPDTTDEGSWWGDPALGGLDLVVVPDLVRSIHPHRDLRALRWLVHHLRVEQPDVVHTHSSKAGVLGRLAARAAGIPCVHTVHGWGPIDALAAPGRVGVIGLERGLARLAAALVVVGDRDRQTGLARGIGRPDQYRLIRSGIDLDGLGSDSTRRWARHQLGVEPGQVVIGMVGRMAAQKDQATLVDAFERAGLAGSVLVLIGDGPRRDELELRGDRLGVDVRFLGARPDGAALAAGFDVAVNASRWEGLPRTVVEAAAAGIPVVASDVGATSELIEPGRSGWLVPVGDAAALARSLAAATDPAVAERLAHEAQRRAQAFSAERMRDQLAELWLAVSPLERSAATPPGAEAPSDVAAR